MAAQSMLMSGVNGVASGRSLLQATRPTATPFSRLALSSSPSYYKHMPSLSVRTMALFGKSKTKAAPAKKVVAPKPKTEDGIFGTSGGIGFTKENELFVGRVAMIGFAASILGEAVTGKGILSQLNLETGIPIYEAEPLLLFFILFTLLGAIGALGDRGRFVDEQPTGLDKAVIAPGKGFRSALGLSEGGPLFGFTKSNELFVGRLAQLGIAFSIIGEIITGKGALAQLNIETGVPISEIEPLVLFNVIFFFIAAINPGTAGEDRHRPGKMDHAADTYRTYLMTITRHVLNEQSRFPETSPSSSPTSSSDARRHQGGARQAQRTRRQDQHPGKCAGPPSSR